MNATYHPSAQSRRPTAGQAGAPAGGVAEGEVPLTETTGGHPQANLEMGQHVMGPCASRAEHDVPECERIPGSVTVDPLTALKNAYGDARDFLRGGRTPNYRWWKPLIVLFVAAFLWLVLAAVIGGVVVAISYLSGHPITSDIDELEHLGYYIFSNLVVAASIPALFLSVRMVEKRIVGGLSSIMGRIRWDLIRHATVLATVCYAPLFIWQLMNKQTNFNMAKALPFILLAFLLIPFQAAAEEYLFRGWFSQTLRGWGLPAWLTIIVSAIPFAVLHGYGWIGSIDVYLFGICMGWLTIRTGGLEGPIAIHAIGNIHVTVTAVIFGETSTGDEGYRVENLIVSMLFLLVMTVIADLWLRRVIIHREGCEAMTGAFGGPIGDFGLSRKVTIR